jgi:ankyrin repeat protein
MKKVLAVLAFIFMLTGLCVTAEDMQFSQKEMYIREIFSHDYDYSPSGFFHAIKDGSLADVDLFLKSGMDANTTYMKLPAIYFAIKNKQPQIVDKLLNNGVDANLKFMNQTPLITAICTKNSDTVDTLIKHGANVNEEVLGIKPLSYAITKKDCEIIESLLDSGAIVTEDSLRKALKLKDENMKSLVLKRYKNQ